MVSKNCLYMSIWNYFHDFKACVKYSVIWECSGEFRHQAIAETNNYLDTATECQRNQNRYASVFCRKCFNNTAYHKLPYM